MNTRRFFALLLALVLLAGCTYQSGVALMMNGDTKPGDMHYSYQRFDGFKAIPFRSEGGQTLQVRYDVAVDEGSLTIQLIGPDHETVWSAQVAEDAADSQAVQLEQSGLYTLRVNGDNTSGSFNVRWESE